jgi:hypothetical protein
MQKRESFGEMVCGDDVAAEVGITIYREHLWKPESELID